MEAGLELLGTGGWRAATVTAVCEEARLTPRYFYESFATRDELLVAIFDSVIDEVTEETVAIAPSNTEELLRATIAAFVKVVSEDPRKGRAAFLEALGSEALMRRRFDRMRWFAEQLARQARADLRLPKGEARSLDTASLIATGGLIETLMVWLDGGLTRSAEQVIGDYTAFCSLIIEAAGRASVRRGRPGSTP
jgi:AcrR family transcriptional regulator